MTLPDRGMVQGIRVDFTLVRKVLNVEMITLSDGKQSFEWFRNPSPL